MCQQFDFCALHNPFLIYVQRLSSSTWLWLQLPETICFSFLILFFCRIKGLKSNMSNQLDVAKFDQTLTDFLNVAGCKTLQYLSLKMFLWFSVNWQRAEQLPTKDGKSPCEFFIWENKRPIHHRTLCENSSYFKELKVFCNFPNLVSWSISSKWLDLGQFWTPSSLKLFKFRL